MATHPIASARIPALLAALAALLWTPAALACPACAGRAGSGVAQGVLIAAFIFLPFAVVGGVVRFIRSEAP